MLYILDTDHISLLQRGNRVIAERLALIPLAERATTIISLSEQFQGWWSEIARAKSEALVAQNFHYLQGAMMFYHALPVLPYDQSAAVQFERLRRSKIRIGTQDLRIASIALSRGATVVTRNLRDFRQIPDLRLIDWSIGSPNGSIHHG